MNKSICGTGISAGSRPLLAVVMLATASLAAPAFAKQVPVQGSFTQVERTPGFADLIEQVKPAVVRVQTESTVAGGPQGGAPWHGDMEQFFERFFGQGRGQQQYRQRAPQQQPKSMGQGSGFVVSADGFIVTNHHVIDGADGIEVIFDSGETVKAELVGSDPKTDLAVLKIDIDEELDYVRFGDSDKARVGDWVIAIGNPFGLGGTATTGIISARGRDIQSGPFDDYIQIDAPINRGNSGGPLFDSTGRVIGINTAIYSPNGGNVGIGFAVPTQLAEPIIAQLQNTGGVQRGWLGVVIQNLDDDIAASLGRDNPEGALVADVADDSPASRARLKQGDVIVSFGKTDIEDVRDLTRAVASAEPKSRHAMKVWRSGKFKTLKVKLGNSPDEQVADVEQKADAGKLGVQLSALTDDVRQQLKLDSEVEGAVIVSVQPGSPAAAKGLRRGDVITQINQQPVNQPKQVAEVVKDAAKGGRKSVLLLVQRQDYERFVAVELS